MSPLRFLPVLVAATLPSVALAEEFEERLTIPGKKVRLDNLIGEVRVEGHSGSAFEILVRVQGKDATRERIQVERRDQAVLVTFPVQDESRFVYPRLGRGSKSTFQWGDDPGRRRSFWREVFNLGPGRRVTISGSGDGLEMWADATVRVPKGGDFELRLGVGEATAEGVDGDLKLDTASGGVRAERIDGNLYIDTGSGSVQVRTSKGATTVDTGSGHVVVEDVEGDLHVDTGSGRVDIVRARGSKILADTGSGRVSLTDVACDALNVDTGSGGIEASGIDADGALFDTGSGGVDVAFSRLGKGRFEIDTGSGGVTLILPTSPSATIDASTGSGGVNVDLQGVDWIRKTKRESSFRVGAGESRIVIDTGSGSIRIRS